MAAETKSDSAKTAKSKPEDDYDKDILSKNPNLEIAQLRFLINHPELDASVKTQKWKIFLEHVRENEMGPYYEMVCHENDIPIDQQLLKELKAKNTKRLEEISAEIKDAEQNLGESEVRQAWLRKAEYLCQIGEKDAAVSAFRSTYEKTVGMGYRIDLVFNLIRLGLFFLDHKLISTNIAKAKDLMEQGGDWERKNRLRSYEGLYKMAIRDFKGAAALFLEA
ncbi:proteasome Regulatory Particle, partial [Aphelenchoides avenae]